MNFKVARTNWANFFRKAVGLPTLFPVDIVRDSRARKFPLIAVKKEGDVGYDLPAVEDLWIPAATPSMIEQYHRIKRAIEVAILDGDYEYVKNTLEPMLMESVPRAVVPTGIKIAMPNNIWATIEARSSTSSKIMITPDSIIDAGYRGELFAVVFNLGFEDYKVVAGERLVQVIFHERTLVKFREVDKLQSSERGETGFGSTGKGESEG